MRKSLLLFLACGIFTSTFSQPETLKKNSADSSEKWVITPVKGMKGTLGRLNPNSPPGPERSVLIYTQADNKFISSTPYNTKFYNMAPDNYRMMLNGVPVENVPILKGHETRLKAGFLEVVNEGDWWLYDETKETYYTSGNKPGKIALPVGKYKLVEGSAEKIVEVIDEPGISNLPAELFQKGLYEFSSLVEPTTINEGKFLIHFPHDTGRNIKVYFFIQTPLGSYSIPGPVLNGGTERTINFSPNKIFDILLNGVRLIQPPIYDDTLTRIKSGYLHLNQNLKWTLYDSLGHCVLTNIYDSYSDCFRILRNKIALPIGKYGLTSYTSNSYDPKHEYIYIKDEEITEIGNPTDEIRSWGDSISDKWRIKIADLKSAVGRVKVDIPRTIDWSLEILNSLNKPTGFLSSKTNKSYYDLPPGIYNLKLNAVSVMQVPVLAGRETTIRTGILKLRGGFDWVLKDANKTRTILSGNKSVSIALPAGNYQIKIGNEFYPLVINEGLTEEL